MLLYILGAAHHLQPTVYPPLSHPSLPNPFPPQPHPNPNPFPPQPHPKKSKYLSSLSILSSSSKSKSENFLGAKVASE